MLKDIIKNKKAFTLIEIIVVLFIISLALLGIISLIVQSIRAQDYNKKVVIANQLSQEGIELIRQVRDNNWKNGTPFFTNLSDTVGLRNTYYMDYGDSLPSILVNNNDRILQVSPSGFFVHSSLYDDSIFSRDIQVELVDTTLLRVISTVYWTSLGINQSYATETLLYDWY